MYESLFWWVEAEKSEIVLKWTCWLVEMLCDQGSLCQGKIPKRFGFAQNSFLWSAQNSGLWRVVVNVAKEGSGGETGYNEAVSAQARPATTFLQSHTLYHCNLLSLYLHLFVQLLAVLRILLLVHTLKASCTMNNLYSKTFVTKGEETSW